MEKSSDTDLMQQDSYGVDKDIRKRFFSLIGRRKFIRSKYMANCFDNDIVESFSGELQAPLLVLQCLRYYRCSSFIQTWKFVQKGSQRSKNKRKFSEI